MTSADLRTRGVAWCLLALLAVAGCDGGSSRRPVELGGPTMGTRWSLTLAPGPDGIDAAEREAIDQLVRNELATIERLMSTWDETSELSTFNRTRSTGPFPVSPETFEVFRWASLLAGETAGALDVTVLPLFRAWGFGAGGNPDAPAPDEATLARLREITGMNLIELDAAGRTVRKRRPEVECDLSAVAPGYAADHIADALEGRGLSGFLIDVGGELVARGRNADGLPWRIAVEQPVTGTGPFAGVVELDGLAITTSGDYRNYREVDGERVGHIIDPRSGRPVSHGLASVTVVDSRAVRADGLATALMVLGPDEGLALARRLRLAALFIVRTRDGQFEQRSTPEFDMLARS